jgi:hypothetical protein
VLATIHFGFIYLPVRYLLFAGMEHVCHPKGRVEGVLRVKNQRGCLDSKQQYKKFYNEELYLLGYNAM